MKAETLPVVCLAVGDAYADQYVSRLYGMLQRHCPQPFTLLCYSDRDRIVPPEVQMRDCSTWSEMLRPAMRPTTRKLRFFDGKTVPFDEFLYLDITLVIHRDMTSLLDYAFTQLQDLVIVRDWFYPSYNSCVMRIRRGSLSVFCDAFVAGETYPHRIAGDQDFLSACIEAKGLQDQVATFRPEDVASYKLLRRLNRRDSDAAQRAVEAATIVKFHGKPKPHQVLDPFFNFFRMRLKNRDDANFFRRELRREWSAPMENFEVNKRTGGI
ncbi:hypothetical protein B1R32_101123 [Abditibacterium utsteinense]|uniref:Uncharacterized protein n=1 Tax=Abditibacterium utsteinense TaxID=1960156 RepID=A0A2S8SX54_9BACT|nr:hypothetical protein [Abditibacterium utsteinense]PQV65383.1 hypothetical protein B1R32_101123 [Abditibacterium utsteinense]